MSMLTLSDQNFEEQVLRSNQPVLVDFWAPWCGPCKQIAPLVDELAQEYQNKMKIGKVNIDENPQVPSKYGIMAIPTLLFFKAGQIVDQVQGVLSKQQLKERIENHL